MKKTLLTGIFVIIIGIVFVSAFIACDPDPSENAPSVPDTHTHLFGEWQSNDAQHWKECYCGVEYSRSYHTSNPCPVCYYSSGSHTHLYGEWQSNNTQHWKECSCGEEYGRANHVGNPCNVCNYSINVSLNGVWLQTSAMATTVNTVYTINGSRGVFTEMGTHLNDLWKDVVDKGYVGIGSEAFSNLTKTDDLTWTGQILDVRRITSGPFAGEIIWRNCTITMNANGLTCQLSIPGSDSVNRTLTRR